MHLIKEQRIYKTKPWECWQKAKEIRVSYFKRYAQAKEKGILRTGGCCLLFPLPAGLGDFIHLHSEPYGLAVGSNPQLSQRCTEAVEARGYARDLCAYIRNYWGSVFLNEYVLGGPFPEPDFYFQIHNCDSHAKWYQVIKENIGVPVLVIDYPVGPRGEREQSRFDYLHSQLQEAIPWMERVTRREFDDERFIESLKTFFQSQCLWGEICLLDRVLPATMGMKTMHAFQGVSTLIAHEKESLDFHRMLLDEMKYRVKEGIAEIANERCRLMHDNQPPWFFLEMYRFLESYGAVVVVSLYLIFLSGTVDVKEDGTFEVMKTPEQQGKRLKTRDDALRLLTEWHLRRSSWTNSLTCEAQEKSEWQINIARNFKVDGVIMHLNRGCEQITSHQKQTRLALMNAGFPVCVYEGNMADKREFDEKNTLGRLTTFMESMGLKKVSQ